MKKFLVSILVTVLVLGVVATASFAASSTAEKQLPFKGTWKSTETAIVNWPTIYVNGDAAGNTTLLGSYTAQYDGVVQNDENGLGTSVGTVRFTASNGDSFYAESTGLGTPSETPGINHIVEIYSIKSGTGRFAGATGTLTVDRWLNLPTGASTGTIEGTITLR